MARESRDSRVAHLDGIRAVAICSVLALHWLSWYSPLFHGGSVGVDMFFVLSGFIITTVLWRAPSLSSGASYVAFVRRRAARLYPALIGLVVLSTVLYAAVPWAPLSPGEVAGRGGLVLTQAPSVWAALQHGSFWLPALQPFGHTWSLAVEWYFYLLWPMVVLAARARDVGARTLGLGALVAAAVLYGGSLPLEAHWFYFGPTARFGELLVGAALGLWMQGHEVSSGGVGGRVAARNEPRFETVALMAVAAWVLAGPTSSSELYRWIGVPLTVLATVVLIKSGYGSPRGVVHRLLTHPWMTLVGRHSYSLYLWHLAPVLLLEQAPDRYPKPLLGLAAVAATVVLTALSYRFLERPFFRARTDVLSPRVRAAIPVSAPTRSSG